MKEERTINVEKTELLVENESQLSEAQTSAAGEHQIDKASIPVGRPGSARALRAGTVLNGKYQIISVLGEGAFGITYLAWDTTIREHVAVKEYFPTVYVTRDSSRVETKELTLITGQDEGYYQEGLSKFLTEASVLAGFQGTDGIVTVKNFFYENNTGYIVMEYIRGESLKSFLENNGSLSWENVKTLVQPLMAALDVIHASGIVHRDISSDNIIMTTDGRLKLIDFGAARYVGTDETKSLSVIIKEGFAPPEQYESHGKQGPWTDVYALCATMYRMLLGSVPPGAISRISHGSELFARDDRRLNAEQKRVLTKGMDLDIKKRYQSMKALNDALNGKERRVYIGVRIAVIAAVMISLAVLLKVIFQPSENKNVVIDKSVGQKTEENQNGKLKLTSNNKDASENVSEVTVSDSDEQVVKKQYTEQEMLQMIEGNCEWPVNDYIVMDFDGDGVTEMFACVKVKSDHEMEGNNLTSDYIVGGLQVWFTDGEQCVCVDEGTYNLESNDSNIFFDIDISMDEVYRFGDKQVLRIAIIAGEEHFWNGNSYEVGPPMAMYRLSSLDNKLVGYFSFDGSKPNKIGFEGDLLQAEDGGVFLKCIEGYFFKNKDNQLLCIGNGFSGWASVYIWYPVFYLDGKIGEIASIYVSQKWFEKRYGEDILEKCQNEVGLLSECNERTSVYSPPIEVGLASSRVLNILYNDAGFYIVNFESDLEWYDDTWSYLEINQNEIESNATRAYTYAMLKPDGNQLKIEKTGFGNYKSNSETIEFVMQSSLPK